MPQNMVLLAKKRRCICSVFFVIDPFWQNANSSKECKGQLTLCSCWKDNICFHVTRKADCFKLYLLEIPGEKCHLGDRWKQLHLRMLWTISLWYVYFLILWYYNEKFIIHPSPTFWQFDCLKANNSDIFLC